MASRSRVRTGWTSAAISAALHVLIVRQTGILSFGFVRVGAVVCAASRGIDAYVPRWRDRLSRRPPAGPASRLRPR